LTGINFLSDKEVLTNNTVKSSIKQELWVFMITFFKARLYRNSRHLYSLIIAIAAVAGYNVYASRSNVKLSDLALANVEALADK